jgi:hypothetical protein
MTLHDAAMTKFGQWWKRMLRSGYAMAEGTFLHGAPPERHKVKESRRAWLWGLGIPVVAITTSVLFWPLGAAAFAIYPLQAVRLAIRGKRSLRENWLHAAFLVIGKFPEMLGQLRFFILLCLGRKSRLIEYK